MLKNLFLVFGFFTHIQLEIKFTFFLKEKGLGSPKNNDNNELCRKKMRTMKSDNKVKVIMFLVPKQGDKRVIKGKKGFE